VSVELEPVNFAQGFRELLHRRAINVFDTSARGANRMVVMTLGLAKHIGRFTLGVGACRHVTFRAETIERAIDG
jgi:hypothetical protein